MTSFFLCTDKDFKSKWKNLSIKLLLSSHRWTLRWKSTTKEIRSIRKDEPLKTPFFLLLTTIKATHQAWKNSSIFIIIFRLRHSNFSWNFDFYSKINKNEYRSCQYFRSKKIFSFASVELFVFVSFSFVVLSSFFFFLWKATMLIFELFRVHSKVMEKKKPMRTVTEAKSTAMLLLSFCFSINTNSEGN